MAKTASYNADYDERLAQVESDKTEALSDLEKTYAGMINNSDRYFDKQIQAAENFADKQTAIQQEQTDFTIEKIEQQKAQAEKDYTKEQSGAYVDFKKQSNPYGVNAEQQAAAGLQKSGYSETSQVGMYNTYQMRVAMARETFKRAVLEYDNAIKDARLQNNSALAEIAYEALQKKLELSLQGFQYKNQLIIDKTNKKLEIDNIYHSRYMDVLNQINTENAMAEDIRQFKETMKWNTEQAGLDRQHDKELKEIQHNYEKELAKIDQDYKLAYLDAQTVKEKEILDIEYQNDIKKLNQQLENEKAALQYSNSFKTVQIPPDDGDDDDDSTGINATTYDDAISYMKSKGVPSANCAGLMTANEWSRRRTSYTSGKQGGIGSAAVKNYSSYSDYLKDYVAYCVETYSK